MLLRTGFSVAATGQFIQAYLSFTGADPLTGWGLLWALKDVGLGIVAITMITHVWGETHPHGK